MKKTILTIVISIWTICSSIEAQIIFPSDRLSLLQFLNDERWELKVICVEGDCTPVEETYADYPFGIETNKIKLNFCTDEKGDFYTIGKYYWRMNPETFETSKVINSCPEYFKIDDYDANRKEAQIKVCASSGYYSGKLKIVNEFTIEIITNRLEYDDKEVTQVYKRKNKK